MTRRMKLAGERECVGDGGWREEGEGELGMIPYLWRSWEEFLLQAVVTLADVTLEEVVLAVEAPLSAQQPLLSIQPLSGPGAELMHEPSTKPVAEPVAEPTAEPAAEPEDASDRWKGRAMCAAAS